MVQKKLYDDLCVKVSRLTTRTYSTSFTIGIRCLDQSLRAPIYSVYGFVRFADEIVDTFHGYDKKNLLDRFKKDTWTAIDERISLNPILNSFQATVHQCQIDHQLIEKFLASMEMDLVNHSYGQSQLVDYVSGSAEAVGLMCLRIFCQGDATLEKDLQAPAMRLGAALQKVNFLRDLRADVMDLKRVYYPGLTLSSFGEIEKERIEKNIEADFTAGYEGIGRLPRGARLGVYVAYLYYRSLFQKIRKLEPARLLSKRVRLHARQKIAILGYSYLKHRLNLI